MDDVVPRAEAQAVTKATAAHLPYDSLPSSRLTRIRTDRILGMVR